MNSLDLDSVVETFAAAIDFTVGIEEEFSILDPETLDLLPRFEQLRDAADASDELLREAITGELISSEIEIISGAGADLHDAQARQRERRRRLFALAVAQGVALGATGTHPWADYREQPIIDRRTTAASRRGSNTSPGATTPSACTSTSACATSTARSASATACAPVLPLLLAISANSPFLDGRDSGLQSARTQTFTKSFPRCGVPDAFGSWRAYRDYIELLVRTSSIIEFTQVWWSVRPHFSFGTVEVRICDAQSTAEESEALGGADRRLHRAGGARCRRRGGVRRSAAAPDRGEHVARDPLRARRPPDRPRARARVSRARERSSVWPPGPSRCGRETGVELAFPERNGAQRQRRMIETGATREEVFDAACARHERPIPRR